MTMNGNLATEERLLWLRTRLAEDGRIRISDAAAALGVSEMTVRRDLQELESGGVARRVRGGAVAVGPAVLNDRSRDRVKAKARIAGKVVPLLPESGSVGFDASTTAARVAAAMETGRDLTVITNGIATFQSFQDRPGITPVLTGGQTDPRTAGLVGPVAQRGASSLFLSMLVISAAAVDSSFGPSEESLDEAEVKRSLASVAEQVVLAADSSKLGLRSLAPCIPWEGISLLVTEMDPGDVRLDPFRDRVALL